MTKTSLLKLNSNGRTITQDDPRSLQETRLHESKPEAGNGLGFDMYEISWSSYHARSNLEWRRFNLFLTKSEEFGAPLPRYGIILVAPLQSRHEARWLAARATPWSRTACTLRSATTVMELSSGDEESICSAVTSFGGFWRSELVGRPVAITYGEERYGIRSGTTDAQVMTLGPVLPTLADGPYIRPAQCPAY